MRASNCLRGSATGTLPSGLDGDFNHLIDIQRFEQNAKDPEPLREHVDRGVPETCHHKRGRHDGKLAHGIENAEPGAPRHAHVEDDDVRTRLAAVGHTREPPQRGRAIGRLADVVTPSDRRLAECAAERVVVIGQKGRCLGWRPRLVRGRRGGHCRALR